MHESRALDCQKCHFGGKHEIENPLCFVAVAFDRVTHTCGEQNINDAITAMPNADETVTTFDGQNGIIVWINASAFVGIRQIMFI